MKYIGVVITLFALLAPHSLPDPAAATQARYLSPESLGETAERVVRGTVIEVRPHWNPPRTRILTETVIDIAEDYKGAGPSVVRLLQFGGVVDGVRMSVAGALDWTVGEDVVLFLEESLPGRHRVSGFSQGKFSIGRDTITGIEVVRQAGLGAAELVGAPVDEIRDSMPLDELLERALPSIDGER